jgi:hypothetical protein
MTPTEEARIIAETEARIVAWLEALAGEFCTPPILAFFGDPWKRDGQLLCIQLAEAIKAGDHRKDQTNAGS